MTKTLRLSAIALGMVCWAAWAGQAVAAQAPSEGSQAPDNVETTTYKDWQVRCLKSDSSKPCQMTQLVNNPNSSTPIMRVIMEYPPQLNGSAAMAFLVPLGTRLASGLQISVGGDQPIRIPFQVCQKHGCRADLRLKNDLLEKFKHGSRFTVTINGPRGKEINLKVSLMGFMAANNKIK